MINVMSIENIAISERADYWQEIVCQAYVELECKNIRNNNQFFGSIGVQPFGSGKLSNVISDKQHVKRTRHKIKKSNYDHFLLSLQISGSSVVNQNSKEASINAGDIVLYNTADEYELFFSNKFEQLIIEIPRELANNILKVPEKITAKRLSQNTPSIMMIKTIMESMYSQLVKMDKLQQQTLLNAILELVASSFTNANVSTLNLSTTRYLRLTTIKKYILQNLFDFDLNLEKIANTHNISTRYLNSLFSEEELTTSAWIKDRRLLNVAKDLRNPLLAGISITETAYKWGFNDLSNFTKSFKGKYMVTAKEYKYHNDTRT